jgi:hypothetical protein
MWQMPQAVLTLHRRPSASKAPGPALSFLEGGPASIGNYTLYTV